MGLLDQNSGEVVSSVSASQSALPTHKLGFDYLSSAAVECMSTRSSVKGLNIICRYVAPRWRIVSVRNPDK